MVKSEHKIRADCPHCVVKQQEMQARYDELAVLQKLFLSLDEKNRQLINQLNQERISLIEVRAIQKSGDIQIARIRSSTSWRLTAPLRRLIMLIRRGR